MFILRNVVTDDLHDLYKLSGLFTFINLPHDEEILKKKIDRSIACFKSPSKNLSNNYYIFVLENTDSGEVIGVSIIHAQHGDEHEPHFFLKVSTEEKYSETINTGFVHGTLKLGFDTNGPTEIGGLVLHPNFRNNEFKLGKQVSFVRFLYMSIFPEKFKQFVHSELLPPFDKNGKSPLWEAIGRRFLNMDYNDADILSRSNKEFILSLYPSENIYQTLLPMDARNAIGKVGPETEPVKRMLENVGFKYTQEVDPFDGGPHFRCKLKEITPIKNKIMGIYDKKLKFNSSKAEEVLLKIPSKKYDFLAIKTKIYRKKNLISIDEKIANTYKVKDKAELFAIPF
jgi:arginine N-succinyltransferase